MYSFLLMSLLRTHILIGSKGLASGKGFATLMEAAGEPQSGLCGLYLFGSVTT
jgi:hypothetical protein